MKVNQGIDSGNYFVKKKLIITFLILGLVYIIRP